MDVFSLKGKAGSALSRLQGTVHKTVKGWYRLKDFIRLFRKCKTRADERGLLAKEAAAIRTALKSSECTSDQRWHSLAKLLFLHLQGFPVHYGQVECMKLAAACNASGSVGSGMTRGRSQLNAKRLGYLGATMLLDDRQQTLFLMTNTLKQDLSDHDGGYASSSEHVIKCALNCLSALSSAELYMELAGEIVRLATEDSSNSRRSRSIRKRAIICLSAMLNRIPDIAEMIPGGLIERHLGERDHVFQLAACYMIEGLAAAASSGDLIDDSSVQRYAGYLVRQLDSANKSLRDDEYFMGGISDPTLVVSQLRAIRCLKSNAPEVIAGLTGFISSSNVAISTTSGYAILYEAIVTLSSIDPINSLPLCIAKLGDFLQIPDDPNLKMVGLELLHRIASSSASAAPSKPPKAPRMVAALARHRALILQCLRNSSGEDPTIVKYAVSLALELVIDKATFCVILPELLSIDPKCIDFDDDAVTIGEGLIEFLNQYLDRDDYVQKACSILDKFVPNEHVRREHIVKKVIDRLSRTGKIVHDFSGSTTSMASFEVLVWLFGRYCSGQLLSFVNKHLFVLCDDMTCNYIITSCSRLASRHASGSADGQALDDPRAVLDLLIAHRRTSWRVKERAGQMKWMCEQISSFGECLAALPDPLESFSEIAIADRLPDDSGKPNDNFEDAIEEDDNKSPADFRGRRVFEGKGIVVFASRLDETTIQFTLLNPIQHPSQSTTSVSLQVALPKGVEGQLETASGSTLSPFSVKPVTQLLVLKDDHHSNDGKRTRAVRLRCRVKYMPAILTEPQMDTFDVSL